MQYIYNRTSVGLPRTSNNLEGWHNGFQSNVKNHPHLLRLADGLKNEQSHTENGLVKLNTGSKHHRQPKYILLEEKIVDILKAYKKSDSQAFLENLALIIQY
jgi:hypothetical protein